jgi:hypothetical protein
MKLLTWLMESFINTFGITRPKPEQERVASLAIGGFLLAVILVVFSLAGFFVYELRTPAH